MRLGPLRHRWFAAFTGSIGLGGLGDEVGEGWDIVVTVCDAQCPIPPRSGMRLRWNFADPALARGTEEERLAAFRIVRDGIRKRVRSLALRLG